MKTAEFRGCDNLVVARIIQDDENDYVVGSVTPLCEVGSIAKSTDQSSESHYYDNAAKVIINAKGADTISLVVPAMALSALAIVTGATIDPNTGAYMSGDDDKEYDYALGYRLKLTDGTYRYVWRLKGKFSNVPDETSESESDQISTNNQTVQYTGTKTTYAFGNGGRKREVIIDERDGKADTSKFFTEVVTPDTLSHVAKVTVDSLSITPDTKTLAVGGTFRYTLLVSPPGARVAWTSSNPTVASIDAAGDIVAKSVGTTVITATAGNMAAASVLTVSAE